MGGPLTEGSEREAEELWKCGVEAREMTWEVRPLRKRVGECC